MEKKKNILIVDDDPDIGSMLKMMMEYQGYAVILLSNAGLTEQQLSNEITDLVILDMLISGKNGTDVCRSIRSNSLSANVPVLMISALPDARKVCMEAGANEFISKPFEMQDMLAKIDKLLSEKHSLSI